MDLSGKKWCYYIPAGQDPKKHGGYVPSLVVADEAGHMPLVGRDELAAPWIWGATLAEAEKTCDAANARRGLSVEAADLIVGSSMRAKPEVPTEAPCPSCGREEGGRWFFPCPAEDCPSRWEEKGVPHPDFPAGA